MICSHGTHILNAWPQPLVNETSLTTRKNFGADAAPSRGVVAVCGGELCDYTFAYAAFTLWVSNCPFLGEQLTYVEGTQRSFR